MTPKQLLRILWAQRWIVLGTFVLVVGLAFAYGQWWPRPYTARTTLMVDFEAPASLEDHPVEYSAIYMATQIDVLRSRSVALRVVDELNLTENPVARQTYFDATGGRGGGMRAWLADMLLRNLEVEPGRNSRVLSVYYTGSDPRFAATMANAFAQAYVDTNLRQRVNPAQRGAQWFETQLETLRQRLESAQAELSAFQRERGLTATDARLDVETARLGDLTRELTATEAERTQRRTELEQLTEAQRTGNIDALSDSMVSPLVQQLKGELVRARTEYAEAAARYGSNHPHFRSAAEQVALLRSQLDRELEDVARAVRSRAERAESRAAMVREQLDEQRQKVLQLTQVRDELPPYQRKVESAQQAYDLALSRHQQSMLESQLVDTNVTILAPASPPSQPGGLNPRLVQAAAVLIGIALGVALALGWELLSPRVRSARDVAERLNVPVLGSLAPGRA